MMQPQTTARRTLAVAGALAVTVVLCTALCHAQEVAPAFPGPTSDYRGYARHDFTVDGCAAVVVTPKQVAPGRPWIWRAEFFDHRPEADLALLSRGFHLVYLDVGNTFGCPDAMKHWDVLYRLLTETYAFSREVALEGLSRGGLCCYNWAAANPEKVACLYGDAPVCDFKSWPGGKGKGPGSPGDWAKLHVYGDADEVVPWQENTGVVAERYRALGGEIELIAKPGIGHHPHALDDPTPIVRFILKHTVDRVGE